MSEIVLPLSCPQHELALAITTIQARAKTGKAEPGKLAALVHDQAQTLQQLAALLKCQPASLRPHFQAWHTNDETCTLVRLNHQAELVVCRGKPSSFGVNGRLTLHVDAAEELL